MHAAPSPSPGSPQIWPSLAAWHGISGLARGEQQVQRFFEHLTAPLPLEKPALATARVVLSSGGVAGGVISEGQGYGLLLAAAMAAAMEPTDERRPAAIARAHAAFLGWRALCLRTSARRRLQASCQSALSCW